MDLRYLSYLKKDSFFYEPNFEDKKEQQVFKISEPDNFDAASWTHKFDKDWNYYMYCPDCLPNQGWKIHVTSPIQNAQETLNKITPFLLKNHISFKFTPNKSALAIKNSKYAERAYSGKFITIYPSTVDQFISLLPKLAELTKDIPQGAYILNDKEWYDSNVFFRYGGFKAMYIDKGGEKIAAIKDNHGKLIPDLRVPYYTIPSFVDEPDQIKEMSRIHDDEFSKMDTSKFNNYKVINAIHFSDGGGVYKVTRGNQTFVMKEGRKNSGLDSQGKDGFTRLKNEYEILNSLKTNKYTINVYDYFELWQNNYLIEEYVDGTDITEYLPANFPFYLSQDSKPYKDKTIKFLDELNNAITQIHEDGITIGDLNPNNVMLTNDNKIKLIDFETSTKTNTNYLPGLQTPGYASLKIHDAVEADWFAFYRMARFMFLPVEFASDISSSIEINQNRWIEKYQGRDTVDLLNKIKDKYQVPNTEIKKGLTRPKYQITYSNLDTLIEGLRNGIINNSDEKSKALSHGDIRQYIDNMGSWNVANGGFGMIMAIGRTGIVPNKFRNWAADVYQYIVNNNLADSLGLFDGISGIATVLYDLGFVDYSKQLLDLTLDERKLVEMNDCSIYSGLAGIGLNALAFYSISLNSFYLHRCEKIADEIIGVFKKKLPKDYSNDRIPYGLLNGWSGTSLFLLKLFEVNKDTKYLNWAKEMLNVELKKNLDSNNNEVTEILDDSISKGRLLPYLGEGGAGVSLVLSEFIKLKVLDFDDNQDLLEKLFNNVNSYCTYSSGLTRGMSGLIITSVLAQSVFPKFKSQTDNLVESLEMFVFQGIGSTLLSPGDYGYRLSNDLFTGNAGMLLSLMSVKNNKVDNWLPLPMGNKLQLFK